MKQKTVQSAVRAVSAAGFVLSAALCLCGWKAGIFASQERLQSCIAGFGAAGAAVFVLFQAAQVVVPVLPGGLGCLAGVLLFGAWKGFLYNYLGICAGSMLTFLAAKYCGKPILHCFFSEKMIVRYEKWTSEKDRFARLFALAIVLPVAPDDFLCWLAGTTEMTLPRFAAIILLGKPFAIALYSMGLMAVFARIPALPGG